MTDQPFDPERHGFRKLGLTGPGEVLWFERRVPGLDLTRHDPLRLNVYLTRDRDYTTIWFGLIDPGIAEMQLGFFDDPVIRFSEVYQEILFRGLIDEGSFGAQILAAVRVERYLPSARRVNGDKQLECYLLDPAP